ncbi:sigma-54-dependent transcriptional regulator [Derxia gummosa]|uniref:Sigma-54-dependent transcriptional regulator n=1 Tax=Derxia gummosa DSM 723 TaxID=1121388 RepID=A0A8B6X1U5_9BURK|nr:sigma-54 dependent transcriptional regulator [Derxia gummosa]
MARTLVLVIDSDPHERRSLAQKAAGAGCDVLEAASLREAQIHLVRQRPGFAFVDLNLPDGDGLALAREIVLGGTRIALLTGRPTVESAIAALRLGAADYLVRPLDAGAIARLLAGLASEAQTARPDTAALLRELDATGRFGHLIGRSPAMRRLYDALIRVAPTNATVLLVGESGTGKELAAQTVHDLSDRHGQPFVALNCGAISPTLIESEMFGHERGSFTGAERQHRGYFERADGGTLFLDEVTEMPLELQTKLLRVLETGSFMRLGTPKEIEVDVRIVAATNRNPERAVAEGQLRADLYHRLNVFPIALAPLRERGDDIQLLADDFLRRLNASHGDTRRFSPAMRAVMARHAWPGNVRELRNAVQRAYIMSAGEELDAATLDLDLPPARAAGPVLAMPIGISLAEADKRLIFATLDQCDGVKKRAAEVLGISLKTLYNRLESYGLPAVETGEIDGDTAPAE